MHHNTVPSIHSKGLGLANGEKVPLLEKYYEEWKKSLLYNLHHYHICTNLQRNRKSVSIKDGDSREGEEMKIDISLVTVSSYMYYQKCALYTFICLSMLYVSVP